MKKLLLILCFACVLVSCEKPYMQILETKSSNTNLENDYYVYENDMLKITYEFWHDRGLMSFTVFNKLETPIYIDWSKSCYINNSSKMNYWFGESCFSSFSYYGKHYYSGPVVAPGYNISEFTGVSNSTEPQMYEKITFIPPRSNYYRSQFHFSSEKFLALDQTKFEEVISKEDGMEEKNEKTRIYSMDFDRSNTPIVFRNYLAVSKTGKSDDMSYVDNEFYVSSVKAVYIGHALGKHVKVNEKGQHVFEQPYRKKTSFYILHYDIFDIEGLYHDRK
jgi:hypothetical protein